ncbi:MAG TPA: argininosuccinate lyase [Gammaproteobacteria bacterium]|nr:argininosuccinate lyase [Gammaproteobacteria bacterium]
MGQKKLWGGRFTKTTSRTVETFTESVSFDARLYRVDIRASKAHARMLGAQHILSHEDVEAICGGLDGIESDIENGKFSWSDALEDVHMNIEARLTERIGDAGKRLHTARSRNDQVVTDMRLFVREALDQLAKCLQNLQDVLIARADQHAADIMPGFTHLQVAQPVVLGHYLLAWAAMLQRDERRFEDARVRVNICPLGSAALAGTSFAIDRQMTSDLLGFDRPCDNSLDAVSDRDFVIEPMADLSLVMIHLSRMAEELVLWSTEQYRFVDLGDTFCTGSSIMPQKKNPDVAELIRGKTARVCGHQMAMLMLMKGQPLAYNRDNQEDKEPFFDAYETVVTSLKVMTEMLAQASFHVENMRLAAAQGYSTATDLAEYLVRKGVPFRDAHTVVGQAVRYGVENNKQLYELSLETLQSFSAHIGEDVFGVLSLEGSVNARKHVGGTAPSQVRLAIARARVALQQTLDSKGA